MSSKRIMARFAVIFAVLGLAAAASSSSSSSSTTLRRNRLKGAFTKGDRVQVAGKGTGTVAFFGTFETGMGRESNFVGTTAARPPPLVASTELRQPRWIASHRCTGICLDKLVGNNDGSGPTGKSYFTCPRQASGCRRRR